MDEHLILVPYGDFIDGVKAMADLDSIRAIVSAESKYYSKEIKVILGLEVSENA